MGGLVADSMEAKGTRFLKTCVPVSIEKDAGGGLKVTYKNLTDRQTQEEVFDTVMFATGLSFFTFVFSPILTTPPPLSLSLPLSLHLCLSRSQFIYIDTLGRHAVTKNLNLEAVGVKVDPNTNKVIGGHEGDNERSSAPNIYAIGDILHVGILTFCRNHS